MRRWRLAEQTRLGARLSARRVQPPKPPPPPRRPPPGPRLAPAPRDRPPPDLGAHGGRGGGQRDGRGEAEEGEWTEEWPLEPRSPYSASKASAELLVRAFQITHELPTLITRCSNNIGPYQYPEKRVPLFVTNAIDDLPLPVYGDGSQVRDHLYVEDHCAAIDIVLHTGRIGEAYNVGGDNDATGIEVVKTILDMLGKPESLIQYVTDRKGHDLRYALDSSKLKELGWKPKYNYEEAMQRTIDWYLQNEPWWRSIKSGEDFRTYYARNYGKR